MGLLLTNATLASLAPAGVERGDILIEDGRISSIVPGHERSGHDVVDCTNRVVMPGNVCAHTHLYSALARGMPGPRRAPRDFREILEYVWWRLDRALDEASIRSSAAVGALDAVRAGTTTLIDHHASPEYIDGSLDLLAEVIDQIGLRAVLCYEVTDRGGKERRRAGLRENERFIKSNTRSKIAGMVGAHASFTLDDGTLEDLASLASNLRSGVHIHIAEDLHDEYDSLERSGMRAANRLATAGIFNPDSIAAHGIHLDASEIHEIQTRRSWFVHNCRSNMNNSVGRAPLLSFGERTALGTDGIDGDMFAESRTAYFRAREDGLDRYAEQFAALLANGSMLAGQFFGEPIGALNPGNVADLIVLNYDPPTPLHEKNLAWHWMFALGAGNVESVMVQGSWVLFHSEFCNVDEERLRAEGRLQATRVWERMESL